MTSLEELFGILWKDYSTMNKQAFRIHEALEERGEKVVNDHVAFRTFDLPKVGIDVLASPFLELGYESKGEAYQFKAKKLVARHYEHSNPDQPKVFISALKVSEFSKDLQNKIYDWVNQIPEDLIQKPDFLVSGAPWGKISWQDYQDCLKESEYAAWMAAFGFRVNHFTVFYNALKSFTNLADFNVFVKKIGYDLNASGGEIKGSPEVLLEQSSTLAYPVQIDFSDRQETIPGCYYEFARRYALPSGKLFQGFLPDSADKIFESTNFKKNK